MILDFTSFFRFVFSTHLHLNRPRCVTTLPPLAAIVFEMKSVVYVLVLLLSVRRVKSFAPVRDWIAKPSLERKRADRHIVVMHEDNETARQEPPMSSLSRKTGRRAGGRSRLKRQSNDTEKPGLTTGWVISFAVPIVALWLLAQVLFGGGDNANQSNYYYYQSSVYQSRVYGSEGRVDTSRKESVRSNIPGLIDGNVQPERFSTDTNRALKYDERVDEDFDEAIDRAIDSMIRRSFQDMNW